jgi:F-type H+-transporting ATPase subunit b
MGHDLFARRIACETERKLRQHPATWKSSGGSHALLLLAWLLSASVLASPAMAQQPPPEHAAPGEPSPAAGQAHEPAGHAEDAHAEGGHGVRDVIARLVNFGILAGTLAYFLRTPLAQYLKDRRTQVRNDLVRAAEMKQSAAVQIAEINRKMEALPSELEALRAQGSQEIAAEEQRIRKAAAAERDRLLEQARREIDLQVKVAQRELVSHAADLAVGLAAERIKTAITDEDQQRLVDRYVQQLRK